MRINIGTGNNYHVESGLPQINRESARNLHLLALTKLQAGIQNGGMTADYINALSRTVQATSGLHILA